MLDLPDPFRPLISTAVKANLSNAIKSNNINIIEIEENLEILSEYLPSNEKAPEKHLRCLDDSVDFWQERRFKICLMVNRDEFEEIESLLLNIRAAAYVGDSGIYFSSFASLKEKLVRLKNSEKLSFDGIL